MIKNTGKSKYTGIRIMYIKELWFFLISLFYALCFLMLQNNSSWTYQYSIAVGANCFFEIYSLVAWDQLCATIVLNYQYWPHSHPLPRINCCQLFIIHFSLFNLLIMYCTVKYIVHNSLNRDINLQVFHLCSLQINKKLTFMGHIVSLKLTDICSKFLFMTKGYADTLFVHHAVFVI